MLKIQEDPHHSIGTRIEQLAEENPEKIALYYQDEKWTWKSLNEESNKYANYFLQLGVRPGGTIGIMLENSPEYLFITTGINKIQGISALINTNQRKQALTHSFKITDPQYIILDGNCLSAFEEVFSELSLKKDQIYVINNPNKISHDYLDLSTIIRDDSTSNPETTKNSVLRQTAFYIFTAGTTGLPKAVDHHTFKLYIQGTLLGKALGKLNSEDIIYMNTPLYHNLAIGIAWACTFIPGASVVLRKKFSVSEFWKDIQKYKITAAFYIGAIPRYLINQPPSEYEKNHTLKTMGGLGLRKEIWERFKSRFQIDHIFEWYGLTEGNKLLFNADEVPGMVGRFNMSGLALAKVDPETGEFYKNEKGFCIKCKPGEIGMCLFKIEQKTFFTGYKDKEKTQNKMLRNVFRKNDIYFNTGDMLELHDNKWVSFADRFGDTFRWKGENVSTTEVEAILNSNDSIQMSAVFGVAIPNTEGKAGMAVIKLSQSIDFNIDEFSEFVSKTLPNYSIPLFVRIKDELEISGPLKIRKTSIRKEAYNIKIIDDPLYYWNLSDGKYELLTKEAYNNILEGKTY